MTIQLKPLKYSSDALVPAMSEISVQFHHDVLAQGYVDRFNAAITDVEFNLAGAMLHNMLFEQYKPFTTPNEPYGKILDLILLHYAGVEEFKRLFLKKCLKLKGSGWVYLSDSGKIKCIKNHEHKLDVLLLIDMWEHSWMMDYKTDKAGYVNNHWNIIDWDVVSARIEEPI